MSCGKHARVVLNQPYPDLYLDLPQNRTCAGNSDLVRILEGVLSDYAVLIAVSYPSRPANKGDFADFLARVVMIPTTRSRNLLCADYEHEDLVKTNRIRAKDLILEGSRAESCRICKHNAEILARLFSESVAAYTPLLTIGVWAPLWWNINPPGANDVVEFASRYFSRHPDEFPLGNWNELALVSTL